MNSLIKFTKLASPKAFFNSVRSISKSSFLQECCEEEVKKPKCPPIALYPKEVECKMNEQIAMEFMAFYNYLAIFNHFGRSDVGLDGVKRYFMNCAEEEKRHALKLCNFQNVRGGIVNLMDIEKPLKSICSVKEAFTYSLQMEKKLTEKLNELKDTAEKFDDAVTRDFIVNEFIKHQYKTIHDLTGCVAKLGLLKDSKAGIYEFDRDLEEKTRKYMLD